MGKKSAVSSMTCVTSDSISLKVEASGSIIMAWVDGALENSTNADGIIDDFVISDAFDATTVGFTYDAECAR